MPHAALRPLILLGASLSLAGCLYLKPRNVEVEHPDRGTDLAANPYDHLAAPEYSQGRISGFRALFVDPDRFVDEARPAAPLETVTAPSDLSLPEDLAPVVAIDLDLQKLDEGRTVEDVVALLAEDRDAAMAVMPTEGLIVVAAPDDARAQRTLARDLGALRIDGTPLTDLGTVEVQQTLPEALTAGEVLPPEEGEDRVLVVAPAPPPGAPGPERGVLALDNLTTSYAELSLNGDKVGVVPPLAKARVRDIKSGVYEVSYELPNGFTWTERVATRTDLGPRVKLVDDHIELNEPIYFETGSAEIQVRSYSLLDDVAALLEEHPEILKLRIEGHTDSQGGTRMNQDLSEQRAASIKTALVARGIDADRLIPQGFGESRPVASNASPAGRALNRRVEMIVVEQQKNR
jgi:outer membrane protein OmpA-like peptidoglycan-associated protein